MADEFVPDERHVPISYKRPGGGAYSERDPVNAFLILISSLDRTCDVGCKLVR